MSFCKKLRLLLERYQILGDCACFLEDASKYVIVLSKLFLILGNFWFKGISKIRRTIFSIMIIVSVVHQIDIMIYCWSYIKDIDALAEVLPAFSLALQVANKIIILFGKSNQLDNIIKLVLHESWPSNLLGSQIETKIKNSTRRILTPITLQISIGVLYSIVCLFLPLLTIPKVLLHQAWYPNIWDKAVSHQIIYVIRSYTVAYIDCFTISFYDFLYVALCVNCAAQFRLLCGAIEAVGSGEEREIVWKIKNKPVFGNNQELARELLVISSKHHQKLIEVCDEMNDIFGSGHFVQLCATLIAICTSFYNIAVDSNYVSIIFCLGYYFAHFWQLFVYCAASNYLSDWSTYVSDSAYNSKWYTENSGNIWKCLSMVMLRSQTRLKMNAFGLFEMNLVLFLTVMRFSFSLYTFMRTVAD